ncbi:MAG: hypothetical protein H7257_05110 [Taibaiella sp.]|nr:hypothetical protein [Taibaiella sp.]
MEKVVLDTKPIPLVINAIKGYFTTIPTPVKEDNYWFYNISNLAYVLILGLHAIWILIFYNMQLDVMKNLQFISIALYAFAIVLNRKGFHLARMIIGLLEANLHQVAAVKLLGWNAGFQNFIPLIALLPFLKFNESWFTKSLLGLGCTSCYLYINFYIKNSPSVFNLSEQNLDFFIFSNAILCFFLAALWGIVLALSYRRTVNALIKKEQELFLLEKAAAQAEVLRQLERTERDNEIFQLKNVALKNSNEEIKQQKQVIEELVSKQEKIIELRTTELADTNKKLINVNKKLLELIQYNSHNLREPLARIMGAMNIIDFITPEEFHNEIWPQMGKAVTDLDNSIKDVVKIADETVKLYS